MSEHDPLLDEEAAGREFGLELVTRLHGLLRAGRLYDRNNRSFVQHVEELMATLGRAAGEEVTLVCMGDYFYVDGVRLKPRPGQLGLFRALREEFESRALGALRFLPGLREDELVAFLSVHAAAKTPEKIERIPEDLAETGALHLVAVRARDVRSVAPETSEESGADDGERVRARQNFARAVRGVRGVLTRAAQTGRPAIRQARRLVQPIVDSILKDEYSIVGLTAIKEHDEYTFVHCVNVSVLSVAVGSALGLPRPTLANLGVAALLHDLGKLAVPAEVLHKPDRLTPDEWRQIERHPLEGVKMLVTMPGLSQMMLDAMRVCIEHHMNVDGSGYPQGGELHMGPLSRIVAVADVFDALTAHRAYRARPYTGYEALAVMLGPERGHSDPAALWAVTQSVGLYPAGTVMRTHSGHVVLSLSPNPLDPRRPVCRVVGRPGDSELDPASDLRWEPMPEDERVERVIAPEEHRLPIDEMLAA